MRAGNPAPGAWCAVGGRRLKVLRARTVDGDAADGAPGTISTAGVLRCREGGLQLDEVQPEGKRAMPGVAWMAGQRGVVTVDG